MAEDYDINEQRALVVAPIEYISFDDLIKKIIDYKKRVDQEISRFDTEEKLVFASVQNNIDAIWESFINPKKLKDTQKPALPYEHTDYVLVYCRYYSFAEQAKKLDLMLQSGFDISDPELVIKSFNAIRNLGLMSMVEYKNYTDQVFELAKETENIDIIDVYIDYAFEQMANHTLYMREVLEFRAVATKIEIYINSKQIIKMIDLLSTCIPYDKALLSRMNTIFSKILAFIYRNDDADLFHDVDQTVHSPEVVFLLVMAALKQHDIIGEGAAVEEDEEIENEEAERK
ncbi:MAG TPA: hypothetical protein PK950_02695 [Candidatus Paceibacterota bacterium]|nr:hypothetical protein [Candidatus Paceibacterota bacterium]